MGKRKQINMSSFNRQELEHIFAEDFSSPVFPILADLYYVNKEYDRALKVCTVGLKHSPDNYVGQYVLSKICIRNNNLLQAEKLLKNVILKDSCNINALLMLINVLQKLKRSMTTIKKYIQLGCKYLPNNSTIIKHNSKYVKTIKKNKNTLKLNKKKVSIKEKTQNTFSVNETMATKSMYNVMKKQKKYLMAMSILAVMKKQQKNKKFVASEIKIITKHIQKGVN